MKTNVPLAFAIKRNDLMDKKQIGLLETKHLAFAAHCAPTNDVRYYLNAVLVEPKGLVATDGHRMAAVNCDTGVSPGEDIIIPIDVVKTVLKMTLKKQVRVPLYADQLGDVQFTPIDGTYPDWRGVVPNRPDVRDMMTPSEYNPKYLFEAYKATDKLNGRNALSRNALRGAGGYFIFLHQNGTCSGIVQSIESPEAFVLIMPRSQSGAPDRPELSWVRHLPTPEGEAS